jgi:predicted Ser/Thr protein kinase
MEELIKRILIKENINHKQITKATSGFTNVVYFVDEMVIKITNDDEKKKKLKKEIDIYKNIELNNIPQYISSGEIEDTLYLIISKVKGKGLYSVWNTLNSDEKENCIKQIADTLKCFNKQNAEFLDDEYKMYDWNSFVIGQLIRNIEGLNNIGVDTNNISKFIENNDLFNENIYGLVYNDAHFDNFIYYNGKIYLIDFDRVIYVPIDYEMMIFKTMCDNPSKFASEEDEDVVFDETFKEVYSWMKKYYSELFNISNIDKRIKVYQFNYLCNQALNMKNKEIGKNWAKELVEEFDL